MPASGITTLTFKYTVAAKLEEGLVTLTVPPGWTPPAQVPPAQATDPGAVSVTCPQFKCRPSVAPGQQIRVVVFNVTPGQGLIITYSNATAPGSATTSTFAASEQSASAGTLTTLLSPLAR